MIFDFICNYVLASYIFQLLKADITLFIISII